MLKKIFYSAFTGLLLAAFWPGVWGFANSTFNFTFLFAFLPLLLVDYQIRNDRKKRKFIRTFLYGFIAFGIFNTGTTFWVWNAHWSGVLATFLINGGLMSFVFAFYGWVTRVHSQRIGYWALVSGWLALEVFHESWALSFPWLDLGHAFASSPMMIQWYEYTGHRGGTFWILVGNLTLLHAVIKTRVVEINALNGEFNFSFKNFKNSFKSYIPLTGLWLIPIMFSLFLYVNYSDDEMPEKSGAIVQPNVDPYHEKFEKSDQEQAREWAQIIMSSLKSDIYDSNDLALKVSPDVIVFPETFLHEGLQESHANVFKPIHELDSIVQGYPKTSLLVGAMTYELFNKSERTRTSRKISSEGESYYDLYNSAFVLSLNRPMRFYHKSKLVVGVEYMPFGSMLSKLLGDFTINMGGSAGSLGTQDYRDVFTLVDTSIKLAPIICWEQDYGNYVREYAKQGANVFAIITNDGWWGNTLGHLTHMQYSRIRAIENRRWILRSANTGISGFIDPKGQVLKAMTWGEKGIRTSLFRLNNKKTVFTICGDLIGRAGALLFPFLLISVFVRKKVQY